MIDTPETAKPIQTFRRTVSHREAVEAFKQLKRLRQKQNSATAPLPSGKITRFSFGTRMEHLVLMLSVIVLAVTGLAQTFNTTSLGQQVLHLAGGLDTAQSLHHLFGLVLVALLVYHIWNVLDGMFVRLQSSRVFFDASDWQHFFESIRLILGRSKKIPLYDRYNSDEKFMYWVTAVAVVMLSITGLIMRFPTWATLIVPGQLYSYALVLHRWPALSLAFVVVLLHTYQVLLRKRNLSIFNGEVTIEEMEIEHPVELAYLQHAAALVQATRWPQTIVFSLEERFAQKQWWEDLQDEDDDDEDDEDDEEDEISGTDPESIVAVETPIAGNEESSLPAVDETLEAPIPMSGESD